VAVSGSNTANSAFSGANAAYDLAVIGTNTPSILEVQVFS